MRALAYPGPGRKAWEEVRDPEISHDLDAVIRVDTVTICGTDLHILKGDVPEVTDGPRVSINAHPGRGHARQGFGWYDNGWGYTCRLADLAAFVGSQL